MLDYTARADGLKKFSINIKTDDVLIYYELQNMIEKMQNNHNNVKIDDKKEHISKPERVKKSLPLAAAKNGISQPFAVCSAMKSTKVMPFCRKNLQ